MARPKKQVLNSKVESHAATVKIFIEHCFKDGQVACIVPKYEEIYVINGLSYIFTRAVRDDMIESGHVKVVRENDTEVHFMGIS